MGHWLNSNLELSDVACPHYFPIVPIFIIPKGREGPLRCAEAPVLKFFCQLELRLMRNAVAERQRRIEIGSSNIP